MFAVHVKNPCRFLHVGFSSHPALTIIVVTSNQRVAEREAKVLEDAQSDRARRDATRAAAWSSNDRNQRLQMDMNKASSGGPKGKTSLADRAKYQFEAVRQATESRVSLDTNHSCAGFGGRRNGERDRRKY